MDIIRAVSMIDDADLLTNLATTIKNSGSKKLSIDDIEPVKITPAPSLEELRLSQGKKPIVFEDLPSADDDDWGEYSLDELLAAI